MMSESPDCDDTGVDCCLQPPRINQVPELPQVPEHGQVPEKRGLVTEVASAAFPVPRRQFVKQVSALAAASVVFPRINTDLRADQPKVASDELLIRKLYDSLNEEQRSAVCHSWDFADKRGLLRTHVSNNWQISEKGIGSKFYTKDQKEIIEAIFWDLYNPEWQDRIKKQLNDDAGGYGVEQSIALFGTPGNGPFELVMTGRHLTIRCDGNTSPHVAFGGPIFYGHAAEDFNESKDHKGNVFWPQALMANQLYQMLDGKQRKEALIASAPAEKNIHFRERGATRPGLRISELSADQRAHADKVLSCLIEPYRISDQTEARLCLAAQGGLEQCSISFYSSGDIGDDQVWDNWRLEGPSFVWHYRGAPHVHVWVHVADDPQVKITTQG